MRGERGGSTEAAGAPVAPRCNVSVGYEPKAFRLACCLEDINESQQVQRCKKCKIASCLSKLCLRSKWGSFLSTLNRDHFYFLWLMNALSSIFVCVLYGTLGCLRWFINMCRDQVYCQMFMSLYNKASPSLPMELPSFIIFSNRGSTGLQGIGEFSLCRIFSLIHFSIILLLYLK